jgi:hypothetical protein
MLRPSEIPQTDPLPIEGSKGKAKERWGKLTDDDRDELLAQTPQSQYRYWNLLQSCLLCNPPHSRS